MPHPVESGSKLRILNTEVQILYGVLIRYNKKLNKVLQKIRTDIRQEVNLGQMNHDKTKLRTLWNSFWNIEDELYNHLLTRKLNSSWR